MGEYLIRSLIFYEIWFLPTSLNSIPVGFKYIERSRSLIYQ